MFRGLLDLINVLMLWGFTYLLAIMFLVFGIVHLANGESEDRTTIIHQTFIPKIIEDEVCKRIDGCRVTDGVCIDCVSVSKKIGVTKKEIITPNPNYQYGYPTPPEINLLTSGLHSWIK